MSEKYFLTFHTVFILNENIKWLEEFLIYYINIVGVSHFYLYDNDKSTGGDGTIDKNKYGFKINTENNDKDNMLFDDIKLRYKNYITHVKWQPKDKEGNVVYGQNESIIHYINNYGKDCVWTCFLDLDEFIYSKQNLYLPYNLNQLDDNISCISICQKKFIDRFLSSNKYITQDTRCIDKQIGFEWAPKNIVKCKDFVNLINIHQFVVKNKILYLHPEIIRFNHYNTNPKLLSWMKSYYKSQDDFYINSDDNGMLKYSYLFDNNINTNQYGTLYYSSSFNYYIIYIIFFLFIVFVLVILLKNKGFLCNCFRNKI